MSFAISYPSVIRRGWRPSDVNRSACFSSSPVKITEVVVPSGQYYNKHAINMATVDTNATSYLVVHGSSCARNHHGSRVLNLHLVQENIPIFRNLDLSGASHQHLQSASRTQIRLQDVLETSSSSYIYHEALRSSHDFWKFILIYIFENILWARGVLIILVGTCIRIY